jgi:hypothetical protein
MSYGKDKGKPFGLRAGVTENQAPPAETPDNASVDAAGISSSAATSGRAEGGCRSPIFVVERLAEAMQVIKSDAMALAAAIRSDVRHQGDLPADLIYWPIRWKNCEKLFEHTDEFGRTLYMSICFTSDFRRFDPRAQYQLNRLYALVLDTNMLAHGQLLFGLPADKLQEMKDQLDAILVKSAHFAELLKSYPVVIDIVEGRLRGRRTQQDFRHAIQP